MHVLSTALRDVKLIEAPRFRDERGWFAESFNARAYEAAGLPGSFVQDNVSYSAHGVLRGLHYQLERPQGKLVRVLSGRIWDVAVDLRRGSPDFGRYASFDLEANRSAEALKSVWIPAGFAHGFLVLSEHAEVLYKTTDFYHPAGERTIRWDDPSLAIAWPLAEGSGPPIVSGKDQAGRLFAEADLP